MSTTLPSRSLALALVLAGLAILVPATAAAQAEPTACAGPESHRFDFWPGVWDVESRTRAGDGEWTATTGTWTAETVLGGCAFIDFAEGDFGNGPIRGMGSRYYDPAADTWYITWLSTRAPGRLGIWEGGFDDDGTAAFVREVPTPSGTVLSRIRWWDVRDDFAEWEHAVSSDGGESWRATWRMTFRRAGDGPAGDLGARLEALYYGGELRRGVAVADSALSALDGLADGDAADPTARVRLLVARGKLAATDAFTSNRPLDDALATLREAAAISEAIPASPERADALLQLGFAEYVHAFLTGGEFAPIMDRFDRSLSIARELDDLRRTARARFHQGLIHERLGETDAAMSRYTEALALADACGCRLIQSYAQRHVGFIRIAQDRLDRAVPHLRRSLELRQDVGFRVYLPYSNATLAEVLALLGRTDEALPYGTRAVALADSLGAPRTRAVAGLALARVHLERGEHDRARSHYRRVLELATEIGYTAGVAAARDGLDRTGGR